jgi:hypothetical protein
MAHLRNAATRRRIPPNEKLNVCSGYFTGTMFPELEKEVLAG